MVGVEVRDPREVIPKLEAVAVVPMRTKWLPWYPAIRTPSQWASEALRLPTPEAIHGSITPELLWQKAVAAFPTTTRMELLEEQRRHRLAQFDLMAEMVPTQVTHLEVEEDLPLGTQLLAEMHQV